MLLMGVLAMIYPVAIAMLIHGMVQFSANAIRAYTLRKSMYWPSLWPYFTGAILSFIALQWFRFVPDKAVLFLLLGSVPFIGFFFKRLKLDFMDRRQAFFCGFVISGVQILAGVAGPLLDVFFVKTKLNRHQIVASKALTQSLSHILKMIFYGMVLTEWPKDLDFALLLLFVPLTYAGTQLGLKVLNRFTDKSFLRITQLLVMCIGLVYLFRGFKLLLIQ